jgi:hypothetical protein
VLCTSDDHLVNGTMATPASIVAATMCVGDMLSTGIGWLTTWSLVMAMLELWATVRGRQGGKGALLVGLAMREVWDRWGS